MTLAPAVTPDRSRIDALLAELVVDLRAAGFVAAADAVAAASGDAARAAVLFDLTDRVPVKEGRLVFLRFAVRWVARALAALVENSPDEAMRWRDRAASELERYRDTTRGDRS